MLTPLSFTPEFRRKVAELPTAVQQEWLGSLARRLRVAHPSDRDALIAELREVARTCRLALAAAVEKNLGPFDPLHLEALVCVARERFVRTDEVHRSAEDTPLPLDDAGQATISAPHAYLLSYRLVELRPGDRLLELGTGSGYGAALASYIVGERGRVTTVEIDERLASWARGALSEHTNVRALCADAVEPESVVGDAEKIVVAFAVTSLPEAWLAAIPEGGVLVAPVGPRDQDQRLVRVRRQRGELLTSEHGAVRYVQNRSRRR